MVKRLVVELVVVSNVPGIAKEEIVSAIHNDLGKRGIFVESCMTHELTDANH